MHADFSGEHIKTIVQGMIIFILSVAVHEFGHAWVADRLGDRLARRQGRVTLNPLAHADPIGTILLPFLSLAFTGGMGFAWGKPVIHTISDRKQRLLVSFAGPAMNVVLAVILATLRFTLVKTHVIAAYGSIDVAIFTAVALNFILFFFNLIPAFPLDGGSVARGIIPDSWVDGWDQIQVYGPFVLLAFLMIPGMGKIVWKPALYMAEHLYHLLGIIFGMQ